MMRQAQSMLRLVEQLRRHPDLVFVNRATAPDTLADIDTLLLWLPDSAAMLHVDCVTPGIFQLYLDNQGNTPDSYFGGRSQVDSEQIIPSILEHLRESRRH